MLVDRSCVTWFSCFQGRQPCPGHGAAHLRLSARAVEQYLHKLHAQHPLVAVIFQEGQFHAGQSLVMLSDEQLRRRLQHACEG